MSHSEPFSGRPDVREQLLPSFSAGATFSGTSRGRAAATGAALSAARRLRPGKATIFLDAARCPGTRKALMQIS